jgi:hypothetical protein
MRFPLRSFLVVLEHRGYSPDLEPCDFFRVPTVKIHLKGLYFEIIEEIKDLVTVVLKNLLENHNLSAWAVGNNAGICV